MPIISQVKGRVGDALHIHGGWQLIVRGNCVYVQTKATGREDVRGTSRAVAFEVQKSKFEARKLDHKSMEISRSNEACGKQL